MLLSASHRFACVHVPKTAGSSVHRVLNRYATHPDTYLPNRLLARLGIPINHFAPWPNTKFRVHASAAVMHAWLPRATFDSLFKFAFVRNPWDLLVSYWHYLRTKPGHRRSRIARSLPSFEAYIEYEIRRGQFSQSSLLCDRHGRLLVEFVGRYESLTSDFAFVCRRIGVEEALPCLNSTARDDYRTYYTAALRDRVAEAFAGDIERFGYDFDDGARSRPEMPLPRAA